MWVRRLNVTVLQPVLSLLVSLTIFLTKTKIMKVKGTILPRLDVLCAWSGLKEHDPKDTFCDWKCRWFDVDFIRWLCLDIIANTCFVSSLPSCVLFSRASFLRHQSVHGVTDRTPGSCTVRTVHGKMQLDCSHFCHRLFLSLWSELLMTFVAFYKQMSVQEKGCGLLRFTSPFLSHTDCCLLLLLLLL